MKQLLKPFIILLGIWVTQSCQNDTSTLFTKLKPSKTGIHFKNILRETEEFNVLEYSYFYNGGGVAIGDLNNDGLSDIYFTGNMVGSRLYINQGDFRFEEIAEQAGVFAAGYWNTGTTLADVNGDGYLDIYVCRSAAPLPKLRKNLLFINQGDLTFKEEAEKYGIDDSGYSTQGAFFDYDRDGDLDLFVLNHSTQQFAGFSNITKTLKTRIDPSSSNKLYRNDNGHFINISDSAGVTSNVLSFGLGVSISDIDNDGWPDIYISNDYNEQDYLYINQQNGTFSQSLESLINQTPLFSMGCDIADFNNDGYTDILTLDMLPEGNQRQKEVLGSDNYNKHALLAESGFHNQYMRNMLQINNQGSGFQEIGQFSGISNTDWSWSALFCDLDNDGFKDVYITNGYKSDYTNMDFMNFAVQEKINENATGTKKALLDLIAEIPSTVIPNYAFRNMGNLKFENVTSVWGFESPSLSNGAAYGDLDNDGDLDLVINNIGEEAFIYRNNAENQVGNNFITVKLLGSPMNQFGFGAKISIKHDDKLQSVEIYPSRGYQSFVEPKAFFGLGNSLKIDELIVDWPDGKKSIIKNPDINSQVILDYKNATLPSNSQHSNSKPLLVSVQGESLIPNFGHTENSYNDFDRQSLLPFFLSRQGPALASGNTNMDSHKDFYIGGAIGQAGKIYIGSSSQKYEEYSQFNDLEHIESEDIDAIFFDVDSDGDNDLYVASGGYEFEEGDIRLKDRLYINDGKGNFAHNKEALPDVYSNSSCVVGSDIDLDGDIDLFVGGHVLPGNYPLNSKSYLLENNGGGQFSVSSKIDIDLSEIGMVTDATFTDLNNDGWQDLVIVGDWMSVNIFLNKEGIFNKLDYSSYNQLFGWWNTVKAFDFENDGDQDLILGNFGLNSQFHANSKEPIELIVKDFDQNGSLDPILCNYVMGKSYPNVSKNDLFNQLKFLSSRVTKHKDYGQLSINELFTEEELEDTLVLKAVELRSILLVNNGHNSFEINYLPNQMQLSPINTFEVFDCNKDGIDDIIYGGNQLKNRVKYGRFDASALGIALIDKDQNLNPLPNSYFINQISGEVKELEIVQTNSNSISILSARNNDSLQLLNIDLNQKIQVSR